MKGATDGIVARNTGGGAISIDVNGSVTGARGDGISARNDASGAGITITAAAVSGAGSGIRAVGSGAGAVKIVATGMVTGVSNEGVYAKTSASGGAIAVTAASVTGGRIGIKAVGDGQATVFVKASGTVLGTGVAGIEVTGGAKTTDVTVDAVDVSGKSGIAARHSGTGKLDIIATGAVKGTGAGGVGIYARATAAGTLTISAAAVTGSAHGIRADARGVGGDILIRAGSVTGLAGKGVEANAFGGSLDILVDSAAGLSGIGIHATHGGLGKVVVRSAGSVTGGGGADGDGWDGLNVVNRGFGVASSVTVSIGTGSGTAFRGAAVSGTRSGIRVTGGSNSGGISIRAGNVVGLGEGGVSALGSGSGTLEILVTSATGFSGDGIRADQSGTGGVVVRSTGSVTGMGAGYDGIVASNRHDGLTGSVTVQVGTGSGSSFSGAAVVGGRYGVVAENSGGGLVTISAGSISGGRGGVWALGIGGGGMQIRAETVSGGKGDGIFAHNASGPGGIFIQTSGSVAGMTNGIAAGNHGAGDLILSVNSVAGATGDGILANRFGSGATRITVSGTVTGGSGAEVAAIRTYARSGTVSVLLESGASVGSGTRNAILGSGGNSTVTVNTGAAVTGKVSLRAGSDELLIAGGVFSGTADLGAGSDRLVFDGGGFSSVTEMQGGGGVDTLRFAKGSGSLHATVVSEGLKGWESVIVESGATITGSVTLADDSDDLTFSGADISGIGALTGGAGTSNTLALNNVSGTLIGLNVTGWETVNIGAGSVISFGTALTTNTLGVTGTLNVGDDSDASDTLTLTGDFSGSGGTVVLDANFAPGQGASDRLVISGTVAGTAAVRIDSLGGPPSASPTSGPERITGVITVNGTPQDAVSASAFTSGVVDFGAVSYRLQYDSANKRFDLVRFFTNECRPVAGTPGAFVCSGTFLIGAQQSLSASGANTLHVTLNSETPIDTGADAFVLTQPGSAGITFVQSATGQEVRGARSGIVASNSGGGAISIDVNGSVTGASGDGISATNDASGTGITITAAAVSGTDSGIRAVGSGTGAVKIVASGMVTGVSEEGVYAKTSDSGGAITVTAAAVTGGRVGIKILADGAGTVSVDASGTVLGAAAAVQVVAGAKATGVEVDAAAVRGGTGIDAKHGGTGNLDIQASGAVSGTGTDGIGIYGLVSNVSGGGLTITAAAAVTGSAAGIRAVASGTGAVSVEAAGAVAATGTDGIGIDAKASGGALTITAASASGAATGINVAASGTGDVAITASGSVIGTADDGIFVDHDGAGATTITVSSTVTGGAGSTDAAIRTDVSVNGTVTVTLDSGASVGTAARNAIIGGAGNTTVTANSGATIAGNVQLGAGADALTVNSGATVTGNVALGDGGDTLTVNSGAAIAGSVTLGAGSDALTFTGGAFASVTEMDGGDGSNDTLKFSGGSGSLHATVVSEGLKGWESVIVESGAAITGSVKLADDSDDLTFSGADISGIGALTGGAGTSNTLALNGVSGSLVGANVTGWETVSIGAGSVISFGTALTTDTLGVTGTLNVGDDSDASDTLTLTGDFSGSGGTVVLDANFAPGQGASDKLVISGTVAGTAAVRIDSLGGPPSASPTSGPQRITGVITVSGTPQDAVSASAFTSDVVDFGAVAYRLQFDSANKRFDLVRFFTNECRPVAGTPGAFVCSGTFLIGAQQSLSASGANTLHVTLNSETPIDTGADAFVLTQPGSAGITFVQSATGQEVRGARSGIVARNTGGGAISIDVNGSVTGASGDGISATNDASGARITITAAAVTGGRVGIKILADGAGAVSVDASGTVLGAAAAVQVTAGASATGVEVDVAAVTGGTGIEAKHGGTGNLDIQARGAVSGTGTDGIGIYGLVSNVSGGDLKITAAAVTGSAVGIRAVGSGTGAVSVEAAGAVTATGTDGIGIDAKTNGGALTITAADIAGAATGIKIAATGAANVEITALGSVIGTADDGIFVDHDGTGATTITVSSAVTGGADSIDAAIRTDVSSGRNVTILLSSGASVGTAARNAIIGGAGNTTVTANSGAAIIGNVQLGAGADALTVNSGATVTGSVALGEGGDTLTVNSGATVTGSVTLGAGSDALTFAGGAFASVTEMDGGDGLGDTLKFSGGSGSLHATVVSEGLKGWESVIVESGAAITGSVKLADDSDDLTFSGADIGAITALTGGGGSANTLALNNVSGTLIGSNVTGWETVSVGAGSMISFGTGSHTLVAGTLGVAAGGTLRIGEAAPDTDDVLTLTGSFTGGGAVAIDANFARGQGASDSLVITGSVSGAVTSVVVDRVGSGTLMGGNSAERIEGVIDVAGQVSSSAFTGVVSGFGEIAYRLEYDSVNKRFDLVRFFTNECRPVDGTPGAFVCSGTYQIGTQQSLSASGSDLLHVTLNSETPIDTGADAFVLTQPDSAGITFIQSATGQEVRGAQSGIVARNSGGGAISIDVNGSVTGASGDGISAANDASGAGITITAAAVSGAGSGIKAIEGGSGAVKIVATGTVTGVLKDGIYARTGASGGAVTVTAAAVAGGTAGIRVVASGTGAVSVEAAGAVAATGTDGIGIDAKTSGGALTITAAGVAGTATGIKVAATGAGDVAISASGSVIGTTDDGIFVDHDGTGATTITVSSTVTGGAGSTDAAIRTDVSSGRNVTIMLSSGASVGATARNAIIGGAGSAAVTVNSGATITGNVQLGDGPDALTVNSGAAVTGRISLGGGADTVTVNSGGTIAGSVTLGDGSDALNFTGGAFSNVTEMEGGDGTGDTLRFSGGSGSLHATVVSEGLKGWESVIVESGATITGSVTLADDSDDLTFNGADISGIGALTGGAGTSNTLALNGVSGSLVGANVTGWETVSIGAGSVISFGTALTTNTLGVTGTLNVGDDSDANDTLTLTGDFLGSGGTVVLDANFAPGQGASDKLVISGTVAGTAAVRIDSLGGPPSASPTSGPQRITGVITVSGTPQDAVSASAFTSNVVDFGAVSYRLQYDSANKRFDLVRFFTNECRPVAGTPGAFVCSGTYQIGAQQSLSATGANTLHVTLNSETPIDTGADAFVLTQPGSAGVTFVQSATGQEVRGAQSGIVARNTGGGAISIDVNGSVTGASGDGISATNDASGAGITITAAAVSGAGSGIRAVESGAGAVKIVATGMVTGVSEEGVYAKTSDSGGAITVTAAAVTGGRVGIRILADGAGAVSVDASGTVLGAAAAVQVVAGEKATGVEVDVAAVTGGTGIDAKHGGTGNLDIQASGAVSGTGTDGIGIYGLVSNVSGGNLMITAAAVTGSAAGIRGIGSGTGAVSVEVTGAVQATGADGIGIDALASSAGAITITAAAVTGSAAGIRAVASGTGSVSVEVAGAVEATGTDGIGIDVKTSGGALTITAASAAGTATGIKVAATGAGDVAISASGSVIGTADDGIFVDHDGTGATTITVSSTVTGGAGSTDAAIRTDVSLGRNVTILLSSGASVGTAARNAIIGGAGSAVVTANSGAAITGNVQLGAGADALTVNSGATVTGNVALGEGGDTMTVNSGGAITGSVTLGAGSDALTFAGGAFASVTEMDGGDGSNDTLKFSGGSGSLHATVVSEGLKGWESVIVESGATITGSVKLADDSDDLTFNGADISGIGALTGGAGTSNTLALNDVSATLIGSNVTGWETVNIGAGSIISFGTALTADTLGVTGTLNVGDDSDSDDTLTLTGDFSGSGGTVVLDANFAPGQGASDKLVISGTVAGTAAVRIDSLGGPPSASPTRGPQRITGVITVSGTPQDAVSATAFTSNVIDFGAVAYRLEYVAASKRFDLVRFFTNECRPVAGTPGAFVCSGTYQIGAQQSLSASDANTLHVTLNSETPIDTGADAFVLTQPGSAGITFVQSATGQEVRGARSGIVARNTGGGAISIDVNGSVTGASGDGISASNDASGAGITITAAAVSGVDSGIRAVGSGAGAVKIVATGMVTGVSEEGVYAKTSDSGGAITVTAAAVTGGRVGIKILADGAGTVSVDASGTVLGAAAAVQVVAGAKATGVEVDLAAVTGGTGIEAKHGGTGNLDIQASGAVSGTGTDGIGIYGLVSNVNGGDLTITAAAVTGSAVGIRAVASGTGAVSVEAAGAVAATGTDGIGIDAKTSGGALTITAASAAGTATGIKVAATGAGDVAITASGSVIGTADDGIFVDHDGTGATTITLSSTVTGGAGSTDAAIRTDVSSGRNVTIMLSSGASVGSAARNAIIGGAGNTTVTANSGAAITGNVQLGAGADTLTVNSGATVTGSVTLGAGSDALTFAGGAFASVTEMDGGDGLGDTLKFSGGSGSLHATVVSEGLKGWESVIVESGAAITGSVKLADDSDNLTFSGADIGGVTALTGGGGSANTLALNNVSGTLIGSNVTGWETVSVGAGSMISFGTGSHTLVAGTLGVAAGGTLRIGEAAPDTDDVLTLTGSFTGGGAVAIDANFARGQGASDSLVITGSVSGSVTSVVVDRVGSGALTGGNSAERIEGVIDVAGQVSSSAFTGVVSGFGEIAYRLEYVPASRQFDLVRFFTNECRPVEGTPGAFVCSGTYQIGTQQSLNASGSNLLHVTLNSETPIDTGADAFVLTQPDSAGITFVQSATGQEVRGVRSGIVARNTGGGAISIDVNGSVTGASGDGISAANDASGAGITITAAAVSGAGSGIRAVGSGTGAVKIVASGMVTGVLKDGIYARTGASGGAVTVTAAAVAGGTAGIRVVASGTGAVSVEAAGAVAATGTDGIGIDAKASGGALTITAASVSGTATGIKVAASGAGNVAITASGSVIGTADDGIFVDHAGAGATTITVSSTVTGGAGATDAAIRTDVSRPMEQ